MSDRKLMQMALPCPFCGGDKVSVEEGSTFRWMFAMCNNCGAQSGEVRKQTLGGGTPQQWHEEAQVRAIEEWNTRARLSQPEITYRVNPDVTDEQLREGIIEALLVEKFKAQPEPEPVANLYRYPDGFWRFSAGKSINGSDPVEVKPVYLAQPQREWQGLKDEELAGIYAEYKAPRNIYLAIESALREKNT